MRGPASGYRHQAAGEGHSFGTLRLLVTLAIVAIASLVDGRATAAAAGSVSAGDAIRAAVESRFGPGVEISIKSTGVTGDARVFREARPNPSALVGKPVRFTLITETGAAVPVTVVMTLTADRVIATRDIQRGAKVTADDVATERGAVVDVPMRPLLTTAAVIGARALRRIEAGSTVRPGDVTARRTVEPGDAVTAVVAGGAVGVTADFVAADGGQRGDLIRLVNPETKRFLRGRILKEGLVEVTNGR